MSQEIYKSKTDEAESLHPLRRMRIGVAALVATVVVGGGVSGVLVANNLTAGGPAGLPRFSEKTTEVMLTQGQGVEDAVQQIRGINDVDPTLVTKEVEEMPANEQALANGAQPGTILEVPVSVKK